MLKFHFGSDHSSVTKINLMRFFTLIFVAVIGTLALPVTAKERQEVTISYVLAPTRTLPENIRAVAVIDSGIASDEEEKDARQRKWSSIAADLIEAMLQSAEGSPGRDSLDTPPLKIVQRRATKSILDEQDLQLVGIVEGDALERAGRILAVDGLIMSRINMNVAVERSRRSRVDWMRMLGGGPSGPPRRHPNDPYYRRGPGGDPRNPYRHYDDPGGSRLPFDLPQREIEELSRHLTVQCSFSLVDAVTGQAVVQYTSPVVQKTDKKRPDFIFGTTIDESALDPVDYFIGELVERAAQEFVASFVPVRVAYTYEIVGRSSDGEQAVRTLRADDYPRALAQFEAARARKPKRHENVFALGIVNELLGNYPEALRYYRQACSMKVDDDELAMYMAAKDRLDAHIKRIVPEASDQPARARRGGLRHDGPEARRDDRPSARDDDDDDDD